MSVVEPYERRFDEDDGKTNSIETCSECGGTVRTDGGETACVECGLIIGEYRIDHAATLDDYPNDETSRQHIGSPISRTRHDYGISSEIGYTVDGSDQPLPWSTRRKFYRLRRYHSRAKYRTKAEKNLMNAFSEIARLTSELELPFVVREQACMFYKNAQRENLIKGRSLDAMAAGSVYAACRMSACTRTLSEVAAVANCSKQKVRNAYRVLNIELELTVEPPCPTSFISRFASACNVPPHVQHRALSVARQAVDAHLSTGRRPSCIAASCLYFAAQEMGVGLTQSELATVANTTDTTIRVRYRELCEELQ